MRDSFPSRVRSSDQLVRGFGIQQRRNVQPSRNSHQLSLLRELVKRNSAMGDA